MLDVENLVLPYSKVHYIEEGGDYIVWRLGTGKNIEILHLKVQKQRRGRGKRLFKSMLERLQWNPPGSIFGFTWRKNVAAQSFYLSIGFELTDFTGLYRDGGVVFFTATYKELWEKNCANHKGLYGSSGGGSGLFGESSGQPSD